MMIYTLYRYTHFLGPCNGQSTISGLNNPIETWKMGFPSHVWFPKKRRSISFPKEDSGHWCLRQETCSARGFRPVHVRLPPCAVWFVGKTNSNHCVVYWFTILFLWWVISIGIVYLLWLVYYTILRSRWFAVAISILMVFFVDNESESRGHKTGWIPSWLAMNLWFGRSEVVNVNPWFSWTQTADYLGEIPFQ